MICSVGGCIDALNERIWPGDRCSSRTSMVPSESKNKGRIPGRPLGSGFNLEQATQILGSIDLWIVTGYDDGESNFPIRFGLDRRLGLLLIWASKGMNENDRYLDKKWLDWSKSYISNVRLNADQGKSIRWWDNLSKESVTSIERKHRYIFSQKSLYHLELWESMLLFCVGKVPENRKDTLYYRDYPRV